MLALFVVSLYLTKLSFDSTRQRQYLSHVIFHPVFLLPFLAVVTVYKLVTKGTVDEDIYQMQERKAKMNAAIMETDSQFKKNAAKEKKKLLKATVDRFTSKSPPSKVVKSRKKGVKKNIEVQSSTASLQEDVI